MKEQQTSMKQVNTIFRDQLGGHVLWQEEIYNGHLIELWNLPLKDKQTTLVMIQIYDKGGWDYYVQGKASKLDIISNDVKDHFN